MTKEEVLAFPEVRIIDVDEDSGLELVSYTYCSDSSDPKIKSCRGLIYNGNNLVLKSFPYTHEYNTDCVPDIDFSCYKFFPSYEGVIIRLFYFSGKWFLSTHKKLNAFRSKWASKDSFGTLFKKALEKESKINIEFRNSLGQGDTILEKFQNILDKTYQYIFLLRSNYDNRIVCTPPVGSFILHVATFCNFVQENVNVNIKTPESLFFKNKDELIHYVKNKKDDEQGVICFGQENIFKVLNKDYQEFYRIRGNESSIKYRYLQIRMNKRDTEILYSLYPDMKEVFDDYEKCLYDIAKNIYRAYIQRYIRKKWITLAKEEYKIVTECHGWYLLDRENNKISLERVMQILNKQSATNINHMSRRYKLDKLPRSIPQSRHVSLINSPVVLKTVNENIIPDINLN